MAKPAATAGAAVLKTACQSCHALTMVTEARHTPAEWGQVVQRMRANGAELTDAEARSVSVYLATTYPAK